MNRTVLSLFAAVSVGLWISSAFASGPEQDHKHEHGDAHEHGQEHQHAADPAEFKPLQVSAPHKVLLDGVGEWSVVQKHWMSPGSEPAVSYGKSTVTKMLGGLAIMFEYQSTGDMGPFKGFGNATWNSITKQYEGTWMDIMSYDGLDHMTGIYNPATKTMTWASSWTMPDGTRFPTRMIEKFESKDRTVSTFFMTGPDGNEFQTMEIVYTRKK